MKAKSAVAYCQKKYAKTLNGLKKGQQLNEAFIVLEREIKKLDSITQINLYSATTQLLDSLINEPLDAINPLDIFYLRCQSALEAEYTTSYHIVLGLAVIGITCAGLVTGGALGIGIGILAGLWQTPLIYMASLLACELPALGFAALSTSFGIGTGIVSGYFFFKEPKVETAMKHCIEVIKESYIEESSDEIEQRESVHLMN